MTEPISGELYWVRYGENKPFIAEYQAVNKDRDGNTVGPAWWDGITEVQPASDFTIISHVARPV